MRGPSDFRTDTLGGREKRKQGLKEKLSYDPEGKDAEAFRRAGVKWTDTALNPLTLGFQAHVFSLCFISLWVTCWFHVRSGWQLCRSQHPTDSIPSQGCLHGSPHLGEGPYQPQTVKNETIPGENSKQWRIGIHSYEWIHSQVSMSTFPSVSSFGRKILQGILYTLRDPGGVLFTSPHAGTSVMHPYFRNSFPSSFPYPTPSFLLLK